MEFGCCTFGSLDQTVGRLENTGEKRNMREIYLITSLNVHSYLHFIFIMLNRWGNIATNKVVVVIYFKNWQFDMFASFFLLPRSCALFSGPHVPFFLISTMLNWTGWTSLWFIHHSKRMTAWLSSTLCRAHSEKGASSCRLTEAARLWLWEETWQGLSTHLDSLLQ